MASDERNKSKYSAEDELFLERFCYDLLAYMLPVYGFPKAKIPPTNRKENAYRRKNFIKIAGATVFPGALCMRDIWMRMFEARYKTTGLNREDIRKFLTLVLQTCSEFNTTELRFKVMASLGLYNEIILFLNYKGLEIDFDRMVYYWRVYFTQLIERSQEDISQTIDNLFRMAVDREPRCTRRIKDFLRKHGRPYGCHSNVLENFKKFYEKTWVSKTKKVVCVRAVLVKKPDEVSLAEDLRLPPESDLPGNRESPEPPGYRISSGTVHSLAKSRPSRRRYNKATFASELGIVGSQRNGRISDPGVDEKSKQMSLGKKVVSKNRHSVSTRKLFGKGSAKLAGVSEHGLERNQRVDCLLEHKRPLTFEGYNIAAEPLEKGTDFPGDLKSPDCPISSGTTASGARKKPSWRRSAKATVTSEPRIEGNQRSRSISAPGLEEKFEQMNLGMEEASQKSQCSISKRKPSRKGSAKSAGVSKLKGNQSGDISSEQKPSPSFKEYDIAAGLLKLGTDLPGDQESSDLEKYPVSPERDASGEPSRRQAERATGSSESQGAIPKRKPSKKKKRHGGIYVKTRT